MKTDEFILKQEMEPEEVAEVLGLEVDNSPGMLTYLVGEDNVAKAFVGADGDHLVICEGQLTEELVEKILTIATPYKE